MVAEICAALADVREEVVETSALVAWRSSSEGTSHVTRLFCRDHGA